MSSMTVTPVSMGSADSVSATKPQRQAKLRQVVNEMVGTTFFAPMLKMARDNAFKGKIGHGGRGEDMFAGQLDIELARRMGSSMNNSVAEAIYNRFAEKV